MRPKRQPYQTGRLINTCLILFFAALFLCLPQISIIEHTINWQKLAHASAIIGFVCGTLPASIIFWPSKYYGREPRSERCLAWFFFLAIPIILCFDLCLFVNNLAGDKREYEIKGDIGSLNWSPRNGVYLLHYRVQGADVGRASQELLLREDEEKPFKNQDIIILKVRSGYFGCPILLAYHPESKTGQPPLSGTAP